MDPVSWWAQHIFVILNLYPTGRSPTTWVPVQYVSVWTTKALAAFIGADGKTYGPYAEGMLATVPKGDADQLIAKGSASYTPPVPPALSAAINATLSATTRVEGSVSALSRTVDTLSATVGSLSSLLYATIGLQVIVLVVAIVTIMSVRKKPTE